MKKILFFSFVSLCTLLGGIACSDDDTDAGAASLPAPTNVRLLNRTESSLVYAWDAVDGATAYTCRLQNNEGKILRIQEVTEPTIELTGLTKDAVYAFSVCTSYKGAGPISAYTESIEGVPGEPMPSLAAPVPTLKNSTPTTLELEWAAVELAIAYEYQLSKGTEVVASARIEATSVTIDDLTSNTEYAFRVKAIVNDGEHSDSPYSSDLAVKTAVREISDTGMFKFPNNEKEDGIVRAFPGAEGAGMYTTGGRGGKVLHVTRLDDDEKEGSLRWAIKQSGPRTIVFDVSGIINLTKNLEINSGNVTIAGQTAPGDGICLRYWSLVVKADNVIIRYIRSRPGVLGGDQDSDGLDAIWGRNQKNVILDHCSLSWSTDECGSFYSMRNFTMQWCLLAESLHNAGHTKGSHGYGAIWGGAPASFHHNMLANHDSRNPRFDSPNTYKENDKSYAASLADRRIDFRNNVVYNFCNFPAYGGEGQRFNFVGNTYKWGPASVNGSGLSYKDGKETNNPGYKREWFYHVDGTYTAGGKIYDEGAAHVYLGNNSNAFDTSVDPSSTVGAGLTADNKKGFVINQSTKSSKSPDVTWLDAPLSFKDGENVCDVTTHSATLGFERVAAYAGASLHRDAVDTRVTNHAKAGTFEANGSHGSKNGIIDLPTDVGGYPTYQSGSVKDSDGDGMPDSFEDAAGLDKNNPKDANEYHFDTRYTNLEMYLHYLVQDITVAQVEGGTYTQLN